MDLSLVPVLAVFVLFGISGVAYFAAKRSGAPYTVILVAIGVGLVVVSEFPALAFLKTFTLTPELLFYIFLPTLIFESAYNINIRALTQEAIPVLLLSVVSLFISALAIAVALFYLLPVVGFPVPFVVALIFGALISATDPVAVLALFKEYGAPRRLALLFEGESLFNDGTGFALFLIAVEFAVKGGFSAGGVLEGIISFLIMLLGGAFFGLLVGGLFSKAIGYARSSESVSITLTLVMAHVTFLLSEYISSHLHIGDFDVHLSSIIATTMAGLMLGNYGRTKLPFGAEEFIEKFWAQIAFFANSIIFILIGMFAFSLPLSSPALFLPVAIVVVVVAVARALSIYPVLSLWNTVVSARRAIPMAWQHVLAWGSLRGALAVTMALLIPPDLVLASWEHDISVQNSILAFTTGCIFITLFFKATTIGPLMQRLGIGRFSRIEAALHDESKTLIYTRVLERLESFAQKGYITPGTRETLRAYFDKRLADTSVGVRARAKRIGRSALRIWILGIERQAAQDLFVFGELSEQGYKRILAKLEVRTEDAEHGESSSQIHIPQYLDVFERFFEKLRRLRGKGSIYSDPEESYMYYRALVIIAHKAHKELSRIRSEQMGAMFSEEEVTNAEEIYLRFISDAGAKMRAIAAQYPETVASLSEKLARFGVLRVEERILDELFEHKMITPTVHRALRDELEREVDYRR